ncbi:MarR family transcriptional regulator [Paenibacillus albiflavus]|uniref:MarR family transcriptional regulator n=1 Tax=Paenibacillus albiflavus TaxID=2545760 RepID=A0A4V2WP03_9BACL|nr:MarR family transcriptional regulator [Paenibacillus albiflavus]TCZ77412.1 MarR family transcriptional regulator [Paenibacillus albiflavus]
MPIPNEMIQLENVFNRVLKSLTNDWAYNMQDLKITRTQYYVLEQLKVSERTVSGLAELVGLTSGAITGIADKLIEAGYIERSRDITDRRIVKLVITEQGLSVLETLRMQRKEVVEKFFGNLTEDEIRHMIDMFEKLLQK